MARWLVADSLSCPEQYFASHLSSYSHYLREFGEEVMEAEIRGSDTLDWKVMGSGTLDKTPDVVFALDRYDLMGRWPAAKRIAQVAAMTWPLPWEVRNADGSPVFDLVISSIPWMVEAARAAGCRAEYQPLAFDLRARACMMGVKRERKCIFIGSRGPNHLRREELLAELSDIVEVLPPVFGRDYFRALASAAVVFNVHAEWSQGAANAMRLYEGGGMGCAVVSDGTCGPHTFIGFDGTAVNARERIESCLHGPQPADWGENWVLSTETYESRLPQLVEWVGAL